MEGIEAALVAQGWKVKPCQPDVTTTTRRSSSSKEKKEKEKETGEDRKKEKTLTKQAQPLAV
jgi:hypothetical protein